MAPPPAADEDAAFPCTLTIRIPFPTPRLATTALRALAVDDELSPLVRRTLSLEHPSDLSPVGPAPPPSASSLEVQPQSTPSVPPPTADSSTNTATVLTAHYRATTNRMLRVATNGFLESVGVVLACMRELDVGVAGAPWVGDLGGGARGGAVDDELELERLERVQGLEERGVVGGVG